MEKNVTDDLRALAAAKSRSETARLRDIINDVECALQAGVTRQEILQALHRGGFTMSLGTFDTALYRIRKQWKRTGFQNAPASHVSTQGFKQEHAPREAAAANASNAKPVPDDLSGLSQKARREQLADKFIRPDNTNPLFNRLNKTVGGRIK